MIRRPPRSTLSSSSAASDVYKRQVFIPSNYRQHLIIKGFKISEFSFKIFNCSQMYLLVSGTRNEIDLIISVNIYLIDLSRPESVIIYIIQKRVNIFKNRLFYTCVENTYAVKHGSTYVHIALYDV